MNNSEALCAAPEFLTTSEVAASLRCSAFTVRSLIRQGQIPATKVGRQYLIPATYLERVASRATPA